MNSGDTQQGGDPRRHLLALRRHWKLLGGIVILIPAAVFGISTSLPDRFEAETTVRVIQPPTFGSSLLTQLGPPTATAEDAARLVETRLVAERVERELGGDPSASTLLRDVEATPESETTSTRSRSAFLTISATADTGEEAAEIANGFADALASVRRAETIDVIESTMESLEADLARIPDENLEAREALARELAQLSGLRASQEGTTQIIEEAIPPRSAVSPKPIRNTGVALVLSLLVAAGLVPLLARLDRRLREPSDLEELSDAPLLAMLPENAFPGGGAHARGPRGVPDTSRGPHLLQRRPIPRQHLDLQPASR